MKDRMFIITYNENWDSKPLTQELLAAHLSMIFPEGTPFGVQELEVMEMDHFPLNAIEIQKKLDDIKKTFPPLPVHLMKDWNI